MKAFFRHLRTALLYLWAGVLYLWQLPQNLIGLIFLACCRDRVRVTNQRGAAFYATKHVKGGVTLGRYVFIAVDNMTRQPVFDHEFGHVRQSKWLGPLWLPVIAIPSGIHCLCCRADNYYHFYTERWANAWGGIPDYKGEYHYHADGLIVTTWDRLVEIRDKYLEKWKGK